MQLISKYEIGDKVWFYHNQKYYEGIITDIDNWNKINNFTYLVEHNSINERFVLYIMENDIYLNKESIPENIFVSFEDIPINDDPNDQEIIPYKIEEPIIETEEPEEPVEEYITEP